MMKKAMLLFMLLALALAAAACRDEETPTPTAAPVEEPAVEPTSAPATEPTAEPTAVPTQEPTPTSEPTAEVGPAAQPEIVGQTWQWQAFQDSAELNDLSVANPEQYTLTLQPDGTASIQADCNQILWSYTLEGSSLTFNTVGPATLAFCGEESLDQQYLAWLGATATYVTEAGQLILNLAADAGNMVFTPAAAAGLTFTPGQISLDSQDLPYSWQAVVVPKQPYDASQPPGPVGLPAHIEILFAVNDPAVQQPADPDARQPGDPIMYLIPVNAYRAMWAEAGNQAVSETIAQIEGYSFSLPSPAPTSGMPALPFEAFVGVNDLAVQDGRAVSYAELNETSASQTGYRFVGRWAQDANPVTNQGLRYVYQGFTNDGAYLVSFWYPVTTTTLPNEVSEVPADQMDLFNADPTAAINTAAQALNNLTTDQWQPNLASLDALVASLEIQGMVVAGLQNQEWLWLEGPIEPGSAESVQVADPASYRVTYGVDGTITFTADCNSGRLGYELRRAGMAGGMLATAGPVTLAQCAPDSLSQSFANSLTAAQDYRVRAGGDDLELILPAGGGTLYLQNAALPLPETPAPGETPVSEDQVGLGEELSPDSIQMDLRSLAQTFEWQVVEATPIGAGPDGQGFPRHIVVGFDGVDPLNTPYSERKILYLFPVDTYVNLYQAAGSDVVSREVAQLEELIATAEGRQGMPEEVMPLLPPPSSLMVRWVQFLDLPFGNGQGVRYISDSPFRQSIGVWSNETTDYYYQGLTEDGRFYVSFKWPVSTASLPETAATASPEDQQAASASPESYIAYEAEVKAELNSLGPKGWSPDLAELDALIASLTFSN